MKNIYIIITEFVLLVHSAVHNPIFFPNLPIGEYRVNVKSILKCNDKTIADELQHNFFLSKLSSTRTEVKGNMTYKIPLDDSLSVHLNMAVKDSIGSWKDNAHVIKASNAYSSMKNSLGTIWGTFFKSFGINNMNCPINPGVYVSNGYEIPSNVTNSKFPKNFFYGTYKSRTYFTDKLNKVCGCTIFVIIEIKRPWETE